MLSPPLAAEAAKPHARLVRYWTDSSRDYNGRLSGGLYIRVEWVDASGVTRTSCGPYFADDHYINWQYETPPRSVHALACDCALDAGETAEFPFAGHETRAEMDAAVERCCASCGVAQPSVDYLSNEGQCPKCFIAAMGAAS